MMSSLPRAFSILIASRISFSLRQDRFFFFQAEDGIRDRTVTGVQTCALPISEAARAAAAKQQEENAERLRAAYAEAQSIRAAALKEAADEQRKLVEAARREAQQLRSEERRVGKECR